MSKFYDEIALYYNKIFPMQETKLQLILELLQSTVEKSTVNTSKDILDVACATGAYASKLADLGHRLIAIDLDGKMIRELKNSDHRIDARVMNMLEINQIEKSFDLIYCLGNSIVHLDSKEDVERFFSLAYQQLKTGGRFLFQIINYDRILDKGIDGLPTIENQEANLSFVRNYRYLEKEHKIAFQTVLKVNDQVFENTVKLLPIRHKELIEALTKAGFYSIQSYGGFNKESFDLEESVPCIMIAKK